MARSPRRAAAEARTRLHATRSALRSLTISIAIVLAITQTPACGFIIRRPNDTSDSVPDLKVAESALVETRYNVESLNVVKPVQNKKDELTTASKTSNTKEGDKLEKHSAKANRTGDINDTTTVSSKLLKGTKDNGERINLPTTFKNKIHDVPENQQENKLKEITEIKQTAHETTTLQNYYNESTTLKNNLITINETRLDHNVKGEMYDTTTIMHTEPVRGNNTDSVETPHYSEVTESTVVTNDNNQNLSETTPHLPDIETTQTTPNEDQNPLNETVKPKTITEFVQINTDHDFGITQDSITTDKILSTINPGTVTDIIETTRTIEYDATLTNHMTFPTSYPLPVSNLAMIKVETARLSPDTVMLTPMPSQEQIKVVPSQNIEITEFKKVLTNKTKDNSSSIVSKSTISPQITITKAMSSILEIVVSKRGGYIINTEAPSLHQTEKAQEKTTTDENLNNIDPSFTGILGTLHDSDLDIDGTENKNVSGGVVSQRQLEEDAIKEELLVEKRLHEYEESMKRYNENGINNVDAAVGISKDDDSELRVKPFYDKKINASLYAVNPNYKPLKKIEVQPPKTFIRDPDDNSWRNESISSLGIVFKPKNSSKSFTEVLKNKTEIELNNTPDKENKGDIPDLRVRLEKMAEVRKSKKKKINKFGDVVYTDYEENSSENTSAPLVNPTTTATTPFLSLFKQDYLENRIQKEDMDKILDNIDPLTTKKPKKLFNIAEYYDTSDEYESDFVKLAKIDIKKSTVPSQSKVASSIQPSEAAYTTPLSNYMQDRQPTVQYFPPTTKRITPKVNMNDYDGDFRRKLNMFTFNESPKNVLTVPHGTVSPSHTNRYEDNVRPTTRPFVTPVFRSYYHNKNHYLSDQPQITAPPEANNDGRVDRGSYVIKHYRDFINEAVKANEEDEAMGYVPVTEPPVRGVTIDELAKLTEKDAKSSDEEFDYDSHFRKEVISRFVDNFNQHSDRFKVDFPILYNSSVHHGVDHRGRGLASSTAFLKRQYGVGRHGAAHRSCDPHCDKATSVVELSPEYELHYYVPEQEEREEMEQKPAMMSYSNKNSDLHL